MDEMLGCAPVIDSPVNIAAVDRAESHLTVSVARSRTDIEDAQRLRFKVFAEELGACLPDHGGLDVDEFDEYCDHVIVRDEASLRVVGTYRVLPPHRAIDIGRLYSEGEFDLHRLDHLRPSMIEVGRSCVHRDYRNGPALMTLWAGMARYMKANGCRYSIGCASAPLVDGGKQAAYVRDQVQHHLCGPEYRVFPRLAFPHERISRATQAELPPLIKGYLRVGAKVCGEPAWDPEFNSADFLMMLEIDKINRRYARHFDLLAPAHLA